MKQKIQTTRRQRFIPLNDLVKVIGLDGQIYPVTKDQIKEMLENGEAYAELNSDSTVKCYHETN